MTIKLIYLRCIIILFCVIFIKILFDCNLSSNILQFFNIGFAFKFEWFRVCFFQRYDGNNVIRHNILFSIYHLANREITMTKNRIKIISTYHQVTTNIVAFMSSKLYLLSFIMEFTWLIFITFYSCFIAPKLVWIYCLITSMKVWVELLV